MESSGALEWVATLFLLLVHDALHTLAQLFKRFAFLDKLEDRFQQRLRYIQVVHFLTSFCKSWLLFRLISSAIPDFYNFLTAS